MLKKLASTHTLRLLSAILLILLIILVGMQVKFIFNPIVIFVNTFFVPVLLAGTFCYLLIPLVEWLTKYVKKRSRAVILVFFSFIGLFVLALSQLIPALVVQIQQLIKALPGMFSGVRGQVKDWQLYISSHPEIEQYITDWLEKNQWKDKVAVVAQSVLDGTFSFLSGSISVVFTIFASFFILFFMLYDGPRFPRTFSKLFPPTYQPQLILMLKDVHIVLLSYLKGQVMVSFCVGVMAFIGYTIIGLDYALLLAFIAFLTNFIPYFGPFLGAVPAVVLAFLQEPVMALYAIIVMVVAQQIDSNIISPYVQGKTLQMHPLTIFIVLLVAGNIAGLVGVMFGIPFYAAAKTIFRHVRKMIQIRKEQIEESPVENVKS